MSCLSASATPAWRDHACTLRNRGLRAVARGGAARGAVRGNWRFPRFRRHAPGGRRRRRAGRGARPFGVPSIEEWKTAGDERGAAPGTGTPPARPVTAGRRPSDRPGPHCPPYGPYGPRERRRSTPGTSARRPPRAGIRRAARAGAGRFATGGGAARPTGPAWSRGRGPRGTSRTAPQTPPARAEAGQRVGRCAAARVGTGRRGAQ